MSPSAHGLLLLPTGISQGEYHPQGLPFTPQQQAWSLVCWALCVTQGMVWSRASTCHIALPPPSCSTDLYNISNTRGKVGTFCIFKTVYKIGEDVIGTFNFSEGDIPCLQVSADFGHHCGERFQVGELEMGLRWHWAAVGFLTGPI